MGIASNGRKESSAKLDMIDVGELEQLMDRRVPGMDVQRRVTMGNQSPSGPGLNKIT
jgi:hypothetical protein